MVKPVVLLVLASLAVASAFADPPVPYAMGPSEGAEQASSSSAMPVLFEVSTRPWLYSLSKKYGRSISKLADIPEQELKAIADEGFTWVWMMGMWELGEIGLHNDRTRPELLATYKRELPDFTLDDVIGSPYAVVRFEVNPQLGTPADLKALRSRLSKYGLKLMLDFVPNHTAIDSPWTTDHTKYYVRAPPNQLDNCDPNRYLTDHSCIAYGKDPYTGSWWDTAQLNYWEPETRQAMTDALMHVASYADGIRCDMAMLLLNDIFHKTWGEQLDAWKYSRPSTEFWTEAIRTVKSKHPGVVFMAEVYWNLERTLQSQGFDFTYDKDLYDHLVNGNLDNLRNFISGVGLTYLQHSAHFVSNHDEDRAIAKFGSPQRADAAAAISMTLPGMKFYWQGQLVGQRARLDVHLRRGATESPKPDVKSFYDKLISITRADVFTKGTFTNLGASHEGCEDSYWRNVGYRWSFGNEKRLVVVNYSDAGSCSRWVLSDAHASSGDTLMVTELFSGEKYERSASEVTSKGLMVVLPAWGAQIFSY